MLISTLRMAPEPTRSRRAAEDVESVKRLVGLVAVGPRVLLVYSRDCVRSEPDSALCSDSTSENGCVTAFVGSCPHTLTFTVNTATYFCFYSNLYYQLLI